VAPRTHAGAPRCGCSTICGERAGQPRDVIRAPTSPAPPSPSSSASCRRAGSSPSVRVRLGGGEIGAPADSARAQPGAGAFGGVDFAMARSCGDRRLAGRSSPRCARSSTLTTRPSAIAAAVAGLRQLSRSQAATPGCSASARRSRRRSGATPGASPRPDPAGWNEVSLKHELTRRLQVRVHVGNDATLGPGGVRTGAARAGTSST